MGQRTPPDDATRRAFVAGGAICVAKAMLGSTRPARAQQPLASAGTASHTLVEDLVAANRILVNQGVLDTLGHVSARHDRDANRYLLSQSRALELVSADDIMEYDLDSNPVDAKGSHVSRTLHPR